MATRTLTRSVTGTGYSDPIEVAPDCRVDAIGNVIVAGGATCAVQYTLDGTHWLPLTGMESLTSTDDFTVVFPVYQIRLHVSVAGASPCLLIFRQNDGRNQNGS